MVSKEEFIAAFADELRGLLLESFADAVKIGDHASNGQKIIQQMKRANNLLERCYYKMAGQPPAKAPANGQPANAAKPTGAAK